MIQAAATKPSTNKQPLPKVNGVQQNPREPWNLGK